MAMYLHFLYVFEANLRLSGLSSSTCYPINSREQSPSLPFMEPEGLLPFSQHFPIGPYPESD